MSSEAEVHFELHRHLENAIEERCDFHGIRFKKVTPEKRVNKGSADIVVETHRGDFLVIEAKKETEEGRDWDIDPFSTKVIKQASGYADELGAPYFATYNGKQLVLFETFKRGVPLLERQAKAYEVTDPKKFALTLLREVAGIEKGKVDWEPKPDVFVKRLKSFHDRLGQELIIKLEDTIRKSERFKEKFKRWISKQGWGISKQEKRNRFVDQASYLLMNKLFFYKVYGTEHEVPKLSVKKLSDPENRRKVFEEIVEVIDFEPIYEHDPIFDEIPLTERASREVQEFLKELDQYNLGEFKHDTVGYIYEDTIPPETRHDLGQYYTPPKIVELIVKLTVRNPDDEVLDPGCGSGTFLITAYNHLKELKENAGFPSEHTELLKQINGIDINRFPAHLTAINLALQDLETKTEHINVEVQDFFNLWPSQDRIVVEKVDSKLAARGVGPWEFNVPPQVDVVVANPPYIRQEIIPDKKLARTHLGRLGYESISDRSDIYVYFFTHATEFLREKGRIGFITSDKWLTVGYGKDLQKFFLDNFKIKAIISFSKRVFKVPLIGACVTILEKAEEEEGRSSNIVKFIRIKGDINLDKLLDDLIEVVETNYEPDLVKEEKNYRLITKKQSDLHKAEKWNRYLYAPPIYWKLLNHDKVCRLGDVAEVRFGTKTGANDFFYLRRSDAKGWGISERFLKPIAKSIRQIDKVEFTKDDTDLFVIDVHGYIQEKLQEISGERIEGIKLDKRILPKNADLEELSPEEEYILYTLYKDGYKGLFKYIVHAMWEKDWGAHNPPHKRPTCKQHGRKNGCWFDLGKLRESDLIFEVGCWKRVFTPINGGLVLDKRLYEIHCKEESLKGILNSSLYRFFRELHGRITGAGMSEYTVYEAEKLPVLDPRELSGTEKENIVKEFFKMVKSGAKESENLDIEVLKPLSLDEQAKEITAYAKALSKARREGVEVSEMIAGIEKEVETGELKGAEIISAETGQRKLTEF